MMIIDPPDFFRANFASCDMPAFFLLTQFADSQFADSQFADSLIAESLIAESLIAESLIAESQEESVTCCHTTCSGRKPYLWRLLCCVV